MLKKFVVFCLFATACLHAGNALDVGNREVTEIVSNPQLLLIHNFLQEDEADALIELAEPLLERSRTGFNHHKVSNPRTSSSAVLPRDNPIVQKVIARAADMVGVPSSYVETPQVVRYLKGQEFKYHLDAFPSHKIADIIEQRWVTFFVYLNDLESDQGGKTRFPKLSAEVTPEKDMAVVFWDCDNDGKVDKRTLHAGMPVKYGVKWGLNVWVHFGPIED